MAHKQPGGKSHLANPTELGKELLLEEVRPNKMLARGRELPPVLGVAKWLELGTTGVAKM